LSINLVLTSISTNGSNPFSSVELSSSSYSIVSNLLSKSSTTTSNLPYKGIYVSYDGDDSNDGLYPNTPIKSLQLGIYKAILYNLKNIYVKKGLYTPGNGLNIDGSGVWITNISNLTISGGWSSDFVSQKGYSELNGINILQRGFNIENVSNITIEGFVIENCYANIDPQDGGGLRIDKSVDCKIKNLIISNNRVNFFGGGMYLSKIYNSLITNVIIIKNNAYYQGGAISIFYSTNNKIINNKIYENSTIECDGVQGGGGIFIGESSNNILKDLKIYNNTNEGIHFRNSKEKVINCIITNNIGLYVLYFNNNSSLISNCVIGGSSNSDFGIYEGGEIDTINHSLIKNIFITNNLNYLYYDFINGYIKINKLWININNCNFTGATKESTNNIVTNNF